MYKTVVSALRIVFGLWFFANGIDFWLHFMPITPPANPAARAVVESLINSGFMFHAVKIIEVVTGLACIFNVFTPLALVAAFPVTVNAFMVDVFLVASPEGFFYGGITMLMNSALLFCYLKYYRPMLVFRANTN